MSEARRRVTLALLLLLPLGAVGVLLARIDPNAYKPRLEQAAMRATGRTLTLNGRLGLRLLPALTLTAADITLSNPPGFSRPEMLRADGLQAGIALLPLLHGRLRLTRLTLVRPDILFETNAAGLGNWHFAPVRRAPAPANATAGAAPPSPRARADGLDDFARLQIEDARLGWRDDRTGRRLDLAVKQLEAAAPSATAPVSVTAEATYRAVPFTLHATLPPMAGFADAGALLPAISAVSLHAGPADLGFYAPGLQLTRLDVSVPRFDAPVQAAIEGHYSGAPLTATATLGAPESLLSEDASRFPVKLSAGAAGGTLSIQGGILHPTQLSGVDLAVTARLPDLAAFGPLLHRSLPPLKDIAFGGRVADSAGSLWNAVALSDARLTLPQGDLGGEATIAFDPPALRGSLTGSRIDADALRGALAAPAPAPAATPVLVPVLAPTEAAVHSAPSLVIPDTRLPFQALRREAADLQLGVGALTAGRLVYHDVSLHLVLAGGHLRLEPIAGQIPGGRVEGQLDIDTSRQPPPVALVLHAPGLALQTLLAALGLPDEAAGSLALDADLHGAGDTLHRIAADLDGHLGLAMVDGSIDNRLLVALFGDVLRSGRLPPGLIGSGGRSDIRCFAARLDARDGVAGVRAFLLDMTRFRAAATGVIDLKDEALALRVRPYVKLGSSGVVVPLRVGGTLAAPRPELDPNATEPAAAKGGSTALAGEPLLGAAETGDCAPALALARDGRPGPLPGPEKSGKAGADLLRGLLR